MDYLCKASILLCCFFFLLTDGQHAVKRFGRKGNDDASKIDHTDYLRGEYSSKSNQDIINPIKEKSTESRTNAVSDIQLQESSLPNSLPRRQGRRSVAFGSRLRGRKSNSSVTTIRPSFNVVKSQSRGSTEKPISVDFFKKKENGSRPRTFSKVNSQAADVKDKEQSSTTSDIFKTEEEGSISTSSSFESGEATHGKTTYRMGKRFTTKRGFNRQSKPGFVATTVSPVSIHAKTENVPTATSEKSLGDNQLQGEKQSSNDSLPYTKPSSPFHHLKSRINQRRFSTLKPASDNELLKAESKVSEIFSNKDDGKVAEENPNDSTSSSLQIRKVTRFTKRPFNKLSSNLEHMFTSKSTYGLSSDSVSEEQIGSHMGDSFNLPNTNQEFETSGKLNNKNDENISDDKTNEPTSSSLRRRKTTRPTKRPLNKLNSNFQNSHASKFSDESSSDYFNEDQNLGQLEGSFEQLSLSSQTEAPEKETKLSEIRKKGEPGKINEGSNRSFNSNRLKGIRFTRRPSSKLNGTRESTTATKPIRRTTMITEEPVTSKKEEDTEKNTPNTPLQWSQTDSLKSNRHNILYSENIEDAHLLPFLPNHKKGNRRKPSNKLNSNQQGSRVTNSKTITDISEEVNESQQQFSNLKFDPIKPTQWPQEKSLDSITGDNVYSENNGNNQPDIKLLSSRKRGNKRRPSHKMNSNQADTQTTNPNTTTDISEDMIKSQHQYSNLQFDPIKPTEWSQTELLDSYTGGTADSENIEDTQSEAPFLLNLKKGNKRKPSNKLISNQQHSRITNPERTSDISEDVIKSQHQYSNLQFDSIKPPPLPQTESLKFNGDDSFYSENIESTRPATPILSNRKKGNRRRPSQKLRSNQKDSRITNIKRTIDINEDVTKSQQQYSNLQFDPIKSSQRSQKESVGNSGEESIDFFENRQENPFISNYHRRDKNTKRPSHHLNRPRQNAVRTRTNGKNHLASDIQNLNTFENSSEVIPLKSTQVVTNETPKRVIEKTEEYFSQRDVIPFHAYGQRRPKNTRRPADKNSIPSTQRQTDITQKPQTSQTKDYQERFLNPNADQVDRFSPFRPSRFPINVLPQRSSERYPPFEANGPMKESKPRGRPSNKLNSNHQSSSELSVLNSKTHNTRFEKHEITPSRDSVPFIPSQYDTQPYFYPTGYSINENERFEMHPVPLSRIAYNSRHIYRTTNPLTEVINSDRLQSFDRTQNKFKTSNNTRTTSVKYAGEDSTESSGNPEVIFEPKGVFNVSAEDHGPIITTDAQSSSKHLLTDNKSLISKHSDFNFVSSSPTEAPQNYQSGLTLERIQPGLKNVPTSAPEQRISESLNYQFNYNSESNVSNNQKSYNLSHFPENTHTPSDYFAHELYYSQITERPTTYVDTKYTIPANSLPTVTELPTSIEPKRQRQSGIQVINQDTRPSVEKYDGLSIGTSTATNEPVIFHSNMKQRFPSQAFTSVSVKYPSFLKNEPTELKNTQTLSKPFISSPLSTIFDTSSENGQYYHYVMNIGKTPPTSKGIAKTKIYSTGNALYTILHENESNAQSISSVYETSTVKNVDKSLEEALYLKNMDPARINNSKSIDNSNFYFESEENLFKSVYNETNIPQNQPKKTENGLNEQNIASISHTLIQDVNFTESSPLVEVTADPNQLEFILPNMSSKASSALSLLADIFNDETTIQTRQQEPSTTTSYLPDISISESNESLNQSYFPEMPTESTLGFDIFGNYSSQNRSLTPNPFQVTETTQNYSNTENELSLITLTETSTDVPSTFDYLGNLDKTILKRIYLLAKRNEPVSFRNVSYKLDFNKLLRILNENASVSQLTTKKIPETTTFPLFYDEFMENSTSIPLTTENSKSLTPLHSEENISDIRKTADNSLPLTNLYVVKEGSELEDTTPITEATTTLPVIKSSPMNNFQLSFDSSKVKAIDKVILPDISDLPEPSDTTNDASKDLTSYPMLEVVIKDSSVNDFISKINSVPVVIRVFNPISKSYHSVLITPEGKSNEDTNFVDTNIHGNISHFGKSLHEISNISDPEIIGDDVKPVTNSDEGSSDADQTSNIGVYFDTILPNESTTDNIRSSTSNENDDKALTSVSPSQPERKFISVDELKELLMKSVEQSADPPIYSTTHDEAGLVRHIPHMDEEQRINDKFAMLTKQSQFPIEMNDISPEDISISISESVVMNPEPESDTSAETQDIFKKDEVPPVQSEPRETEMDMSMLKNVDDPIKMVLSIMETYKPPKEATMWKDEAFFTRESPLGSPLDSQKSNGPSSDEWKANNDKTPLIVSSPTESPLGLESLVTENYQLTNENSAKDAVTPFLVPLKIEPSGSLDHPIDDKPLHLIPIYYDGDEFETPAESQRVYELQLNGDLKRIFLHSKLHNNRLTRPNHPADKVSHKTDPAELPFSGSMRKINHQHNAEFGYAPETHSVKDYGTYLQYSRIGSLHNKPTENTMKNDHVQVADAVFERNKIPAGFHQYRNPSSSSDILPEDSTQKQIFSMPDTEENDEKSFQHLNTDSFGQSHESGESSEILTEEESNIYQKITDITADDAVPVIGHVFKDGPQHSDKRPSAEVSFQKNDINGHHHTEISRIDRHKNNSNKNGKSYYRTLPQFISQDITGIEQISYQVSDDAIIRKKSSLSEIQKQNSKSLPQHTTSDTLSQKGSSNWDDTESTVKYVKTIPYVEPRRNEHAVTKSENSISDQFILFDDTDEAVNKPNNQQRQNDITTEDKTSDDDIMMKTDLPLNDDNEYLYPIFKTDKSKYERSKSK